MSETQLFSIQNFSSSKYWAVYHACAVDGAQIVQYDWNQGANQKFRIIDDANGWCYIKTSLEFGDFYVCSSREGGDPLGICIYSSNLIDGVEDAGVKWRKDPHPGSGFFNIVCRNRGLYINLYHGSWDNDQPLCLMNQNGQPEQQWEITALV